MRRISRSVFPSARRRSTCARVPGSGTMRRHGYDVEGAVELPVPAAVEPVSDGVPGGCGEGAHPADRSESCFASDPTRVRACNEGCRGGNRSDPGLLQEIDSRAGLDEFGYAGHVLGEVASRIEDTFGQSDGSSAGSCRGGVLVSCPPSRYGRGRRPGVPRTAPPFHHLPVGVGVGVS
jgi:hypothetical protein